MNILFVCTGNTCRSPMACAIFKKLCEEDNFNVNVDSCGLFATVGACASIESINSLKKYDIDISKHKAKQISDELIKKADVIITMTNAHKMLLAEICGDKTFTACELAGLENEEIPDPYGCDQEEYDIVCDKLFMVLSAVENNILEIVNE